ncbi:carbohydrate ABC transporter permease [Luedemannella helvata]|uniref:Carbohydrate ABC transporter permease n=1 Tax=Luedemannella helvata TaxID=349315 RepID=A0ABN2JXT0_9ACTN
MKILAKVVRRIALTAAILLLSAMVLLPFVWMVSTAFKRNNEILVYPPAILPESFTLEHFRRIFSPDGEWRYFQNSLIATAVSTVTTLALAIPAAYSLGAHRFPRDFGRHISVALLLLRFLPPFAVVIPLFSMVRSAGLLDSVWALVLVYTAFHLPLAIWIIEPAVRGIPREIQEAALVDGATPIQTMLRVTVPLLRPAVATAAVFCTVFSWNEFFFSLVLTFDQARTYPVLINTFVTDAGPEWGLIAASALLAAIPVIVFCVFMQRHLIRGLTAGSVK